MPVSNNFSPISLENVFDGSQLPFAFPSSEKKWENANSLDLLNTIYAEHLEDWNIVNIDSTIILQTPTIKPYIEKMKENVNCGMTAGKISIKATTTDYLGFIGEGKGIAVITTCLLCNHK